MQNTMTWVVGIVARKHEGAGEKVNTREKKKEKIASETG